MSKIALSVAQMKHLEALGIDTSRASMSYLLVSGDWELRYADAACREVFSQDYRPAFILLYLFLMFLTSSEEILVPSDKETMSMIPISTPRKSSAASSSSSGMSIVWYR